MKKIIIFLIALLSFSTSVFSQNKKDSEIRPALLVIDVQNQFLQMVEEREKVVAIYMINAYIKEFRELGLPIIRIYHSDKSEGPFPGTPEFEYPEEIAVTKEDVQVIKTYGNSFTKTDLEKILAEKGVNTVFLCGLSSVGCVLATWFGAHDHDLKAFLLKDALMSHNSAYTNQVEDIFDAVGYDAVEVMLK